MCYADFAPARSTMACGLSRDGGLKVWLENERKEIKAEKEFAYAAMDSEVAAWLDEAARKYFPESEYARD
jgi:hypothetical protein